MEPLPQEIRPVTPQQARLTAQHLQPALADLEVLLLRMRRDIDKDLSARLPAINGKAYPYGRCLEISQRFLADLRTQLRGGLPHRGLRALRNFINGGGQIHWVWGALREQYFQNAFQFGALYVDVSNDTVTVTKPPVEILPLKQAGFVPVQGIAHYAKVAKAYWNADVYVNDVVPALAPMFPMLALGPRGPALLASATDYMVGFFLRDRFVQAEAFLREGPSLPPDRWRQTWASLPGAQRAEDAVAGRAAAVAACEAARAQGGDTDPAWRAARLKEYAQAKTPCA